LKVAILRDHHQESSEPWETACKKRGIEFLVINILRNDWLDLLLQYDPSFCLSRPPGDIRQNKNLFDEKIFFLENFTSFEVFPGFLESYIYENKSTLAWFLNTNNIKHPKTFVSSDRNEAEQFLNYSNFPMVSKTLIGAAGSGVKILRTKRQAENYINKAFAFGIKRRYGPNRKTGTPILWFIKAIKSPKYLFKKLNLYKERNKEIQKNIVLFQQYIPHDYEWRCVKIGESYFAYKKLRINDLASGSKQFVYGKPPFELLDFTKSLCERFDFNFMAIDLFYQNGLILVNELQTIFGHKNSYICKVDDKPGRYVYYNKEWIFQEGDFNTNESYDLRLQTAIDLFNSRKI